MDKRKLFQIMWSVISNGNVSGFVEGNIYKGSLKKICAPGMNCYSCPGAFGACPVGSFQAVIGSVKYSISFYVLGFVSLMGVLFGRQICGWACPFGLVQELLFKTPLLKLQDKGFLWIKLRYLKHLIMVIFVIVLPMLFVNDFGLSPPYYCEYICPVGTLEGGVPLVLLNHSLRETIGLLFAWKMLLLVTIIVGSMIIYRPFCKYMCPLGAFYGLFNSVSFLRLRVDKEKCIHCNSCITSCKMNINVCERINDIECVRCGDCIKTCPTKAIERQIL